MAKTLRNSKLAVAAETVIADYRLAYSSRRASIIGRAEVLRGNATFGIFGDGKEVAQVAMAKAFRPGDWRAGYYRDQTFMWATRMSNVREFFSQLYGNTNLDADPASGGRQMGNHFATRFVDDRGDFKRSVEMLNSTADVSNVAGWMPRLLGLAYASKLYRNNHQLRKAQDGFSVNGDEVAFGTIGDAATSEGHFWETFNAAGVLQVPIALSVWDDGYGISVPISAETTKASISDVLRGFIPDDRPGVDIYVVRGWDYSALVEAYANGVERVRREHKPALFHITELTQPQGHSTSGSHERYKTKERLRFEVEYDCITRMRDWIIESGIAGDSQLEGWEAADKEAVEAARDLAWEAYQAPIRKERDRVVSILRRIDTPKVAEVASTLNEANKVTRSAIISGAAFALRTLRGTASPERTELVRFIERYKRENSERYNSHVYSNSDQSPLNVPVVPAVYSDKSPTVDGRQVLLRNFDANFARDPRLFVIGEDVGRLGDVNLVFEGLQAKYGDLRLTDTGIREATILGQSIGAAMRGLRPICDIQYLDYFLYALEVASDDLASLHWRTAGGQKAPVVMRTKGHRLVGIWHAGSPMAVLINALHGMYIAVPRNMTQAAGFYNTLFRGDNPGVVIEVLNGYRLKERVPDNVGEFTVPLGVPEVLCAGTDVTVVTYGACCAIALDAARALEELGVSCEVIDVQTLNPFDTDRSIVRSLEKTHAALFLDEDMPGGASAFMMQQVLERQNGWWHLDAAPRTLAASPNRPAYGPDGDYFSKPNRESVVEAVYELMRERNPDKYAPLD
ncbi:MAG: transketolase [Actinobacteria bacterium 13_1_20CM_2_65_11]|nr:MAG: transketolase [Actinobacteria bacterium 13_1_40CM_2_65_8]OLE78630.1 MAG: transketolase [Actinobacteria bacterium 13_1_20CM_2_65_11]